MIQTLFYSPGQTATVFLEVLNSSGERADGYSNDGYFAAYADGYWFPDGYAVPLINRLIFPDLTLAEDYPTFMTKLDVGFYYYQFILPKGAIAVGSYIVDMQYINPASLLINTSLYQISVNAPFGNFNATTG